MIFILLKLICGVDKSSMKMSTGGCENSEIYMKMNKFWNSWDKCMVIKSYFLIQQYINQLNKIQNSETAPYM